MYDAAAVAVVVTSVGVAGAFASGRRPRAGKVNAEQPPDSLVRVLTTEEEVQDAVRRVVHFEESAAALMAWARATATLADRRLRTGCTP